jgi:hypothetical protein
MNEKADPHDVYNFNTITIFTFKHSGEITSAVYKRYYRTRIISETTYKQKKYYILKTTDYGMADENYLIINIDEVTKKVSIFRGEVLDLKSRDKGIFRFIIIKGKQKIDEYLYLDATGSEFKIIAFDHKLSLLEEEEQFKLA